MESPSFPPFLASQASASMLQPSSSESACQEAALPIAQQVIYQTNTTRATSHTTPNKLNTVQIFDRMRAVICRVITPSNQASGFVFSPKLIITTYHSISGDLWEPIPAEPGQFKLKLDDIQIESKKVNELLTCGLGIPRPQNCPPDQKQKYTDSFFSKSKALDLICLTVTHESLANVDTFPLIPENFTLKEGMKVYLAGFPLRQTSPTFHKGIISSVLVDSKNITTGFTIDGTIVAGNSGGPVFVEHQGTLYLAGVIVAEVADLDAEFHKTTHILEQIAEQAFPSGIYYTINCANGTNERFCRDQFMIKAINSIKKNMSTGIGKAIDARYIQQLMNPSISVDQFDARMQTNELLVKRPKSTSLVIEEFHFDKNYSEDLYKLGTIKYKEERLAGTKRAVEISIPKENNLRQTYLTDPDPHDVCANKYLNDAKTFYKNAAMKFCESFIQAKRTIPNSFDFKAYGKEFRASLKDAQEPPSIGPLEQILNEINQLELSEEQQDTELRNFLHVKLRDLGFQLGAENSTGSQQWHQDKRTIQEPSYLNKEALEKFFRKVLGS
jgi:hypothetical protein